MSKVVLLVEDNDFIRNMYQLKLTKADLEVIEAVDGEMALAKIQEHKPDIILLDLMMPGIGGLDVLKKLHKMGITPDTPTIILTNVMDQNTVSTARQYGARDYIVKTDLTPTQVVEKIEPYL